MSFVWHCFDQAGMSGFIWDGKISGWPHHYCDWFRANGKFSSNPSIGAVVFWQFGGWSSNLSTGHSEIVVGYTSNTITTIGAITGGIQVRVYSRNSGLIVGYGNPY